MGKTKSCPSVDRHRFDRTLTPVALTVSGHAQNVPNVLKHVRLANNDGWQGTEITVVISGNWTTYKVS
jgi:hypothetical protein